MSYKSFEDLNVWKMGVDIATLIYKCLENCKDYSLKDQMCRAAVSISSSIAEGAERGSNKDFIRFLHISKGSAAELRTQLMIAENIGILSEDVSKKLQCDLIKISSMLHKLIQSLSSA